MSGGDQFRGNHVNNIPYSRMGSFYRSFLLSGAGDMALVGDDEDDDDNIDHNSHNNNNNNTTIHNNTTTTVNNNNNISNSNSNTTPTSSSGTTSIANANVSAASPAANAGSFRGTVPVPHSRPQRLMNRRGSVRGGAGFRQTSSGTTTNNNNNNSIIAEDTTLSDADLRMVEAVASMSSTNNNHSDNNHNNNNNNVTNTSIPAAAGLDRSTSWYADAVHAGFTSADLHDLLGPASAGGGGGGGASNMMMMMMATPPPPAAAAAAAAVHHDSAFGDEEVLEQYRIMAQHEANLRVKENTGFDMNEYEKRRKLQADHHNNSSKKSLFGNSNNGSNNTNSKKAAPSLRLPLVKKITTSNISLKLEEPPMPPPRVNNYFLEQRGPRVPDLCPGVAVRGSTLTAATSREEHVVRCLGCRTQLRVKLLATLVSCPECNTVSPASSTRR